jgi:hypothetical protein
MRIGNSPALVHQFLLAHLSSAVVLAVLMPLALLAVSFAWPDNAGTPLSLALDTFKGLRAEKARIDEQRNPATRGQPCSRASQYFIQQYSHR